MKANKWFTRAAGLASGLAMALSLYIPASATDDTSPVIDDTKTASLTIHKYDLTADEEDDVEDYPKENETGEEDVAAEGELEKYALSGVVFSYLKVADMVTVESVENGIRTVRVKYKITDALESVLNISEDDLRTDKTYSAEQLNAFLVNRIAETGGKDALEDLAKKGTAMTKTDANGETSASGLPLGLYLLAETAVPEEVHTTEDPLFVSLPMTNAAGDGWLYDVEIYPKSQTNVPTIDKKVKRADDTDYTDYASTSTASTGDVLDYVIISKLPTITGKVTYLSKYDYKDTSNGSIAYKTDADVTVRFFDTEANALAQKNAVLTLTKGTDYTVTVGTNEMEIAMTDAGLEKINPAMSDKYMAVFYQATLTDAAVMGSAGNDNDVELVYSRTNEEYTDTLKDKARVYTYGLNLQKTFSDGNGDPTKVQFVLAHVVKDDPNDADAETVTYVQAEDDSATADATATQASNYQVTKTDVSEAEATKFSPGSNGILQISGLQGNDGEDGKDFYRLTEVKTANGYLLLKEPVEFVIKSGSVDITPSEATRTGVENDHSYVIVTGETGASATINGTAATMSEVKFNVTTEVTDDEGQTTQVTEEKTSGNAMLNLSIVNNKGFELPKTGGHGTILFAVIGAVGLAAAVILLIAGRRKERDA